MREMICTLEVSFSMLRSCEFNQWDVSVRRHNAGLGY